MFEPGSQIGRYEIQRRLGRGGMGTVYAAHDSILGRLVAIKVFAGDLDIPDARERFVREARSAAALAHPHIVAVHDFGDHDSQPYIVMEYVKGETLAELIRRKPLVSQADKLRWIEELASAAGYAHRMSVIHRDIKPANLMIDKSGHLKVLDFGIARMLGTVSNTRDTIGTPGYMAPEQILGEDVDGRADLFAIGVVFYELLAYADAFPGDTGPAITHRILHNEPVPLPRLVPDLNPEIQPIIERALKKNVDERYPDAEAFRAAVSRVRKRFEDDTAQVAPTILIRDTPAPSKRAAAGTAPARRPATDAVSVATPPPTDRDALARRRLAQLDAALTQGRTLLAAGDLEMAVDFCQQALTFDEHHEGALELEQEIAGAFAARQAVVDEEDAAVALRDEPVDDELDASDDASAAGMSYAPTVLAPRKTTPPAPKSTRKTQAPQPVPRPPRPAEPSLLTRMRRGTAAGAKRAALAAAAIPARLRAPASALGSWGGALLPRRRLTLPTTRTQQLVWVGIAVVLLLGVAAAIVAIGRAAVSPPGTLVIDALPWGTVSAIDTPKGEHVRLPSPASTPLAISLPAGTYQVTVVGPPPESQAQRMTVNVGANASNIAPLLRFRVMTPEDYFEPYLAAPASAVQPAALPSTTAAPGTEVPVQPTAAQPPAAAEANP
jgi:predicted Ser/Thr protein kinase